MARGEAPPTPRPSPTPSTHLGHEPPPQPPSRHGTPQGPQRPTKPRRLAPAGVAPSTGATRRRAGEAPGPRSTPAPDHPRRNRNRTPLPPPPEHPPRTPGRRCAKRQRPGDVHLTSKEQQAPPRALQAPRGPADDPAGRRVAAAAAAQGGKQGRRQTKGTEAQPPQPTPGPGGTRGMTPGGTSPVSGIRRCGSGRAVPGGNYGRRTHHRTPAPLHPNPAGRGRDTAPDWHSHGTPPRPRDQRVPDRIHARPDVLRQAPAENPGTGTRTSDGTAQGRTPTNHL
nr:uncharacterized protein LOC133594284 [Nerophis lumbriciformis]